MRISNYPTDTLTGDELILATDVNTSTQEYKTVNFSVDTLKTFLVGTDDTNEFTNITLGGSLKFEGSSIDANETTLGVINPDGDRTINLPNQSGTLPVLAVVSTTAITSTPEELNILDGVTATFTELNLLDGGTAVGSSTTVVDADGVIINDGGTMKSIPASDLKTYIGGIPHKIAGTGFSDSLIVGHSTTGTLNNASSNTGVGFYALEDITEGDSNTAVGHRALADILTGDDHTAVGVSAMRAVTGGNKCVAIGNDALRSATAPRENVAVGHSALYSYNVSNNQQGYSVAVGHRAGYAIAGVDQPLATLIGYGAGDSITTGIKNTIVGASADVANATDENSIVIGAWGAGHGSNIAVIGNTDTTAWHPADDNGVDLGSASYSFKDAYAQGIVTAGGITVGLAVTDPARINLANATAITHNDHKGTILFETLDSGIADGALFGPITFNNTKIAAEANVIIQMKSNIAVEVIVYNIAAGSCQFKILNRSGGTITDGTSMDFVYTVINQS